MLKKEGKFTYYDSGGPGETLMLLHGLFGALSNFGGIVNSFGDKYRVIIPILPIYDMPLLKVSVGGLVEHVDEFLDAYSFDKVHILGNSLGGHVALLVTLLRPEKIQTLTLTGSSGLYESAMGNTFPKRGDYDYIKNKTAETFYDPATASKELVDEVYGIVNDRLKVIRILSMAKSAIRHNVSDRLANINCPTLLVWGLQDNVTPSFVGEKFKVLIGDNAELHMLDKCGHAPMMEKPEEFNALLDRFLVRNAVSVS